MEKHEQLKCPTCNDKGLIEGCLSCGKILYDIEIVDAKLTNQIYDIPLYYRDKPWDILKAKKSDDSEATNISLKVLNDLVIKSNSGTLPSNSYMILVPNNHGKRYALFTMIQNYLAKDIKVAPVVDILSLNILFSRNRYEDQELMLSYLKSDITFIYETDFITRKLTSQVFRNLASTRALSDRPTIYLGGYSYKELSSWDKENLSPMNNNKLSDKKSEPFIVDGVTRR